MAIAKILFSAGANPKKMIMLDSKGALYFGREDMNSYKKVIAGMTNSDKISGGLDKALTDADVFVGVSVAGALKSEWVANMADKPIVFAMANPNPEISFEDSKKTKIVIFGTGRSDYPNQINNVLAFPGIFRGALDARAKSITEEMKIAASDAISNLVSKKELSVGIIIPKPFDKRVAKAVAKAVFTKSKIQMTNVKSNPKLKIQK
jgi:malate dehydrogenase (oxaloacetate-decarboxylating)